MFHIWFGTRFLPFEMSREVTFPCSKISLCVGSIRASQNRIFLSKWPLIMQCESSVTRSLQLDPANNVFMQAFWAKSQIFNVLSWLPVTIFIELKNLPARTLPVWPVSVCFIKSNIFRKKNRIQRTMKVFFFCFASISKNWPYIWLNIAGRHLKF